MPVKPRPAARSTNPKTTGKHANMKRPPGKTAEPSRAHRNDTTEAKEQNRRIAKTHPTRNASSARKDSPAKNRRGNEPR
jgi:hypothetical protein